MKELDFAKSLAKEAGKIIISSTDKASSLKRDGSFVTRIDKRINLVAIKKVRNQYPLHAFIGEEGSHIIKDATFTWVCDPLDGTLPFVLDIPTSVFSLALLKNGEPILGVVYDPFLDNMYSAVKGRGAFLNESEMRVNSVDQLQQALVGNSGRSSQVVDGAKFKTHIYTRCYRPIILHSVIYEAMLVASGKIAATVLTGSGAHDAASAKIIVEEAGGKVTDMLGQQQPYDKEIQGAIISNGLVHKEIVEIAKRYRM